MTHTAKQVAAKIVALMVGDWQSTYEIREVRDLPHDGQEVIMVNTRSEEEFAVTVHRRSTAPAIRAELVDGEEPPF